MRPWTPQHSGLQRYKVTHGGQRRNGRGGTVVLHQSFDPDAWLDAVEREQINYAFVVPTMLYALLDHGSPHRHDLSAPAAAPCPH
jgi:hypothetical protein